MDKYKQQNIAKVYLFLVALGIGYLVATNPTIGIPLLVIVVIVGIGAAITVLLD